MDQFAANGAFFLQLVLAHVPRICMVSLVLVLFHFPAELFQCSRILLAPHPIGRQSHTHGQERPGVGCLQLERLNIFYGLLWGPGAGTPPLVCFLVTGQWPWPGINFFPSSTYKKMTLFEDLLYIVFSLYSQFSSKVF